MTKNKTIILAAGCGKRMGAGVPKVLRRLAGFSLLEIVASKASCLGGEVVAVVSQDVLSLSGDLLSSNIKYAVQKERLGTCHALMCGLEKVDNDGLTVVLYGDTPFIEEDTILRAKAKIDEGECDLVVIGFKCLHENNYGKLVVEGDVVQSIEEGIVAPGLCNSGFMVAKTSFFKTHLPKIKKDTNKNEFFLTDIVAVSKKSGKVAKYIECKEDEALGINSLQEFEYAKKIMNQKISERLSANGVEIQDVCTTYFAFDIKISSGCTIYPMSSFGPNVEIGSGVTVGPFCNISSTKIEPNCEIESHCSIKNTTLLKGCYVKSFSAIDGLSASEKCLIGPFSHIRAGTQMSDSSKIGSFVEVKNTTMGVGSKAAHLAYIGDAEVGDGSNMGAGVVVCNYDGFRKHKTKIGQNVFVGSQSTLVAPLEIGDGVVLGTRCLVKRDVESDMLMVPEIMHKSIKSGAIKFRNSKKSKTSASV